MNSHGTSVIENWDVQVNIVPVISQAGLNLVDPYFQSDPPVNSFLVVPLLQSGPDFSFRLPV